MFLVTRKNRFGVINEQCLLSYQADSCNENERHESRMMRNIQLVRES